MNHQPFRDWLLSEEKLSADQTQRLQDHLNSCESCKAINTSWNEVEATFYRTLQVLPAPGFTARWQTHLAEYRLQKQKRQSWITIVSIVIVVLSLLGFSISQLWPLVQSPGPYLAVWFSRLVSLLPIYFSLQNFVHPINMGSTFVTFILLFFLVGIISFMSVLWLATVQKIRLARSFV